MARKRETGVALPEGVETKTNRKKCGKAYTYYYPAGSIGDLITRYRASDEFKRLSEGTQSNYGVHMRRFEAHDTWGMVAVRDLAPITVQTARDA